MKFLETVFCIVILIAAFQDMKKMKISNGCHILILILSVISMLVEAKPEIVSRLFGILCVSFPMLVITLLYPKAFGGGDIKLIASGGMFLGWKYTLVSFATAVVFAGVFVLYLLLKKRVDSKSCFAFGTFLCLGMLVTMLWGEKLINWYFYL